MSISSEELIKKDAIFEVAKKMVIAARTAPKSRGKNTIYTAIVDGADIMRLSDKMASIATDSGELFFKRDSDNILRADAIVLIGTEIKSVGLKVCGYCGFGSCQDRELKNPESPCAFNVTDLGIALGSAVSIAADSRVDNRIMYTIGQAARELQFMDKKIKIIHGIPLSASTKNPFFDRQ